jgi:hypothetical protein
VLSRACNGAQAEIKGWEKLGVKVVPVLSSEGKGYVQDVFLAEALAIEASGTAAVLCGQKEMAMVRAVHHAGRWLLAVLSIGCVEPNGMHENCGVLMTALLCVLGCRPSPRFSQERECLRRRSLQTFETSPLT